MGKIKVLEKRTIDQIAAGEVVERPMSVVKELLENAIDAGATSISVETKNGGIDYIRVTDDGSGIATDDIPTAFQAHATSKIREIEDLDEVMSLGFRGEALSSIASVSKVELITKTADDISGTDVCLTAGELVSSEQIGVPDGTTMIVSDLFFNVPARRKFLKTPATENAAVGDYIEKAALSHPNIRFKWVSNGKIRLATYGNNNVKDLVFAIFGKETADEVIGISETKGDIKISGFLGKPILAKGNKSYENYFINGRFVKSRIIDAALESAYAPFMMQHRFPFVLLYIEMPPSQYDVNVHPTKMELRFSREQEVYDAIFQAVMNGLTHKEMIVDAASEAKPEEKKEIYQAPEPFEKKRIYEETGNQTKTQTPVVAEKPKYEVNGDSLLRKMNFSDEEEAPNEAAPKHKPAEENEVKHQTTVLPPHSMSEVFEQPKKEVPKEVPVEHIKNPTQESFLSHVETKKYRLIGQLFKTYWLIEMDDTFYILDQHAAHEKVLYERKMKEFSEKKITTQSMNPPYVFRVSEKEELLINRFTDAFTEFGFELRYFGDKEYALTGVP